MPVNAHCGHIWWACTFLFFGPGASPLWLTCRHTNVQGILELGSSFFICLLHILWWYQNIVASMIACGRCLTTGAVVRRRGHAERKDSKRCWILLLGHLLQFKIYFMNRQIRPSPCKAPCYLAVWLGSAVHQGVQPSRWPIWGLKQFMGQVTEVLDGYWKPVTLTMPNASAGERKCIWMVQMPWRSSFTPGTCWSRRPWHSWQRFDFDCLEFTQQLAVPVLAYSLGF